MAKRELKANGGAEVPTAAPPKSLEREFGEAMEAMVSAMASQFRREAIQALNKGTVAKFEDAQIGNFASVFLKMANGATRKITKRFSSKRLEAMARRYLSKMNATGREKLYGELAAKTGIDAKRLAAEEGLKFTTNALVLETQRWAQKLRDETLEAFTANTLRAMTLGQPLEKIMEQFDGMVEKRRGHARMVARTQVANFNSVMTKTRAQNAGITEAIWVTSHDERVRPCHRVRDGKRFKLSEGLYSSCDGKTLLPGTDYNCRCTYRMIIPDIDE